MEDLTLLSSELRQALDLMHDGWQKQNPSDDAKTRFIYTAKSLDEVLALCEKTGADVNYALHRWFNYKTSTACESLFVRHGAVKEPDERNIQTDFYIDGTPFDLKLSVFPKKLKEQGRFIERTELAAWMYQNQSDTTRRDFQNRIFIVCIADNTRKTMLLKTDFEKIDAKIKNYMKYIRVPKPITVKDDNGNNREVLSSVIFVQ